MNYADLCNKTFSWKRVPGGLFYLYRDDSTRWRIVTQKALRELDARLPTALDTLTKLPKPMSAAQVGVLLQKTIAHWRGSAPKLESMESYGPEGWQCTHFHVGRIHDIKRKAQELLTLATDQYVSLEVDGVDVVVSAYAEQTDVDTQWFGKHYPAAATRMLMGELRGLPQDRLARFVLRQE